MPELSESARGVVEAGRLGHLVTVNSDGSPQVSLVWVGIDAGNDDEIVMAHMMRGQKIRNIERDPRIALTIEADGENPLGLDNYLIAHGSARLEEGGAPELLQRLAKTYLGPDVKFPPMDSPPPGHVIHMSVEKIGGVGPWAE